MQTCQWRISFLTLKSQILPWNWFSRLFDGNQNKEQSPMCISPSAAVVHQFHSIDLSGGSTSSYYWCILCQRTGGDSFKHVNLNKEILRMNEYDLEQAGFCNKEMNKKLLKKNNGNIKRVVMTLLLESIRSQLVVLVLQYMMLV
ncbi:Next to BRCA1 protein 1 protein [Datura stramonium]|uniref:Next to BRCA1 protein 1 protein n=1 Tax=Datura stramonium TaxID=4076 RepID=A0ABS8V8H3_DATST|nr:Next to BRCA1 protein 1 protein [Datura stramonium]